MRSRYFIWLIFLFIAGTIIRSGFFVHIGSYIYNYKITDHEFCG
ncbi:hypothetical protein SAMN04488524_4746 [Pedobacter africanus]|uniref:Uncharacterized protein n=1 Tax=Pedobacter africanus TaxID=151894 RepID=A0A1W2EEZ5_9SPHI|nr:hypothetical protein SAMN04488524_4746 [Pedobacter africanus]